MQMSISAMLVASWFNYSSNYKSTEFIYPRGSMSWSGIFTYIWLRSMVKGGKYTIDAIHGSYVGMKKMVYLLPLY